RVQRVPVPALPGAAHARRKLRLRQSGGSGRPWRGGSRREHRAARGGSARADSRWRRHAGDPSPGRVAARKGRAYLWGMSVRVAHLIYGLWLGGLEQLVVHLAARSRARGIDSCIVALGEDGPVRPLAQEQGIDVEVLPVDGMSVSALLGIRRALEKHGATVLHAHDLGPWLNAVAVRALRPRTRVMATFHEQRMPQGKKRHAAVLAAHATDALVACGDKVRQDILDWAPAGARVPVIANGVALEASAFTAREAARAELRVPEGAVAIGYAGTLREIKGPDRLLQAFLDKFADRGDVHLYLIGTGVMEDALRAADPALRARLGAHAREQARRHSIEPMVDAYEALYRELAARS